MLYPESRIILSLCDASGSWSGPYLRAGYDVRQVDLAAGQDVRLLEHPGPVWGILAAPPCTVFSVAGSRIARSEQDMTDALSVVDACLRFVAMCQPRWWALENPKGKLRRWLGPPSYGFQPYWFGDHYTKQTYLWGNFTPPRPSGVINKPASGWCANQPGGDKARQAARSVTPAGFAAAFYAANP